jgi:hypothetical protein
MLKRHSIENLSVDYECNLIPSSRTAPTKCVLLSKLISIAKSSDFGVVSGLFGSDDFGCGSGTNPAQLTLKT